MKWYIGTCDSRLVAFDKLHARSGILQDFTVAQEASMDNDEGRENQQEEVDEEEETWDDWQAEGGEDDNDERTKCLFCDEKVTGQRSLLSV